MGCSLERVVRPYGRELGVSLCWNSASGMYSVGVPILVRTRCSTRLINHSRSTTGTGNAAKTVPGGS